MFNSPQRLVALLGLALFAPAASAGILYVDETLTTGANDGSTWADAFQTSDGLQQALAVAVANDQIFVKQGSYKPTQGATRGTSFRLLDDVEVYGGFVGTESSPSERPAFGTALTILHGDLNGDDGSGIFTDNSYHIVHGAGANSAAVLDGFKITGGSANGTGNNNKGGGILCLNNANPTVRNCDFDTNRCTFGGAAGYINNAAPTFTDCIFRNGVGGSFGGAFDIANAGAVRYERCWFEGNTAARAGALEVFSTNGVVVSNSVFVDNTATGSGGGGGIWIGSSNTQVVNCTVVANKSNTNGVGGIRMQTAANADAINCIIWDNEGPGGVQGAGNQANANANVSYSVVEGGNPGTGNVSGDPLFENAGAGNYALTLGSSAIDAADNTSVVAGVTVDYAMNPRFVDEPSVADTGVGTAPIVDMGAYEWQGSTTVAYCTAGTSTNGCQALLSATGTPSATAASGFDITASGVEGSKDGLLFFGANGRQANSWGNGTSYQCVVPPVSRAGLLSGTGTNGLCDGSFTQDLNARWTAKPAQNPGSGTTTQAQLWYRDPMNTSNQTTSLSDAIEFLVGP
jgi:hypothetical protein